MSVKVSIIVPVYNGISFLRACLESVCAQTLREIEILVIDDGSTDGSGALADEMAVQDARIRVIHQENRGLSGARNTGIENAQGEFFGFVDADDTVNTHMFAMLYETAVSLHCEVVTCGFQIVYTDHSLPPESYAPVCPLSVRLDPNQVRQNMPQLVRDDFLPYVWRRLYAKRLFRDLKIRSDTRYAICEDATFCMECLLRANGIVAIPDILYEYRFVPGSLMHKRTYNPHLTNALLLQYSVKKELGHTYMPDQEADLTAAFAQLTYHHIAMLGLQNIFRKPSKRFSEFLQFARSSLMRDMFRFVPFRADRSKSLDWVMLRCIELHFYLPAFCIGCMILGKDKEG